MFDCQCVLRFVIISRFLSNTRVLYALGVFFRARRQFHRYSCPRDSNCRFLIDAFHVEATSVKKDHGDDDVITSTTQPPTPWTTSAKSLNSG